MHRFSLLLIVLLAGAFRVGAQTPRHYVCYRTTGAAPDWKNIPWTEDFVDIEGAAKPIPLYRTRVKMQWDEQYLYVLAEMEEPHIQATLRQRDTIIFHDNDFEVFIDPDGDTHQYYEIEINALNTVMDLFMVRPYRNGGQAMINWDTKGLRTAVQINGTLNNPADKDTSWTVEMAIPFKALSFYGRRSATPEDGGIWRINFSRVQWQMDIRDGQYIKKPRTPEYNWVWSPQGIINMHAPEHWGYLQFSVLRPGTFSEPVTAAARKELWNIYYRQKQYWEQHKCYARDTDALGINSVAVIEATTLQFSASIREAGFITIINQEGKIISRHE